MSSTNGDDELRARFGALRDYDRGRTPEFRQLLKPAELGSRRVRRGRVRAPRWIAAAASIAIVALSFTQIWNRGPSSRTVDATSIISWQSPTAGLLETPAKELLAPPPLLSSVFDGVTATPVQATTD